MSSRVSTPTKQPQQTQQTQTHSGVSCDKIAVRAYEKWCKRGCPQGTDRQDWLEAEAELKMEMSKQGRR